MIISRLHLMRRIISFNKTTEKLLFIGETKNCSYLKTATKVIKKPSKSRDSSRWKTGSFLIWFYVGRQFLSNDGEPSPSRVRCHHDNRYSRCWRVRQYLLEHQLTILIISFDSIKPRLDIEAYIDINAVELGRESVRTILQIIKDHKEGKPSATVNWLTIPLRNFRSLYVYIYCLFRWPRPHSVSKGERSISFLFIWKRTKVILP